MADINRLDNGNIELTLTIPWSDILNQYEKVVQQAIEETEIEGFRKGKAPKNLVEPKLDKTKLYSKSIEQLLPNVYSAALKEHDLKPILHPHIHLTKGEEGTDWSFTATVCEAPTVSLPELEPLKEKKELNDKVVWLRENSKVKIPDMLVEEEAEHRILALAENITQLGMKMDQYLTSKKLTPETLKSSTATQARADLEVEFILEEVRKLKELKTRKDTLDYLQSLV